MIKQWLASRPIGRAALWGLGLGPFFYLTYGVANYLASKRVDVPSIVFAWEHYIPFMQWTILPYWTINAFYGLSLFLARDKHELNRHGCRLLMVQIIAVTFFILLPLGFSFGQPAASGIPKYFFDALRGFDKPFNQAPSLHIALAIILWDFYSRRIHAGWARAILHVWTFVICVSVLTTYQHHFIDIPTGALLGIVCVWALPLERYNGIWQWVREKAGANTQSKRRLLAIYYAVGGLVVAMLCTWAGGIALWAWWVSAALWAVALNYALLGAQAFGKQADGSLRWSAAWLMWPYTLGAKINAWAWTRQLPAASQVLANIALGKLPTQLWSQQLAPHAYAGIVDLTAELPAKISHGYYESVPCLDLVVMSAAQFEQAAQAIDRAIHVAGQGSQANNVLVCCALGFSRSAAALAYWLVQRKHAATLAQAVETIKAARPQVVLSEQWLQAIQTALDSMQSTGAKVEVRS